MTVHTHCSQREDTAPQGGPHRKSTIPTQPPNARSAWGDAACGRGRNQSAAKRGVAGWRPIRRRAQADCPVDAAPRTACDQPTKPPKSAGVSDWKKYTPASHTADQTPPEPEEQADSERMSHRDTWGFVAARQPSSPFRETSESEKVRFNQLNKNTGNRIRYSKVDAETGEEVDSEDIIKGYQVSKGQYIEITDEDLEAVAVEFNPDHRHRPVRPA